MRKDVQRVLISHEEIQRRVRELAEQITLDHWPAEARGPAEITIVPIMTGAMIFCADLIRNLPMPMRIGILAINSYSGSTSGPADVVADQVPPVRGRNVLIVDDVLDTGQTLRVVRRRLEDQQPASMRVCVLLRKPTGGAGQTPVDYVGFDIPDEFVVGYGLDLDDYYRNLPEIVTLKEHVLSAKRGSA
jgi:hypoxanthine phosphoribosyltransferase